MAIADIFANTFGTQEIEDPETKRQASRAGLMELAHALSTEASPAAALSGGIRRGQEAARGIHAEDRKMRMQEQRHDAEIALREGQRERLGQLMEHGDIQLQMAQDLHSVSMARESMASAREMMQDRRMGDVHRVMSGFIGSEQDPQKRLFLMASAASDDPMAMMQTVHQLYGEEAGVEFINFQVIDGKWYGLLPDGSVRLLADARASGASEEDIPDFEVTNNEAAKFFWDKAVPAVLTEMANEQEEQWQEYERAVSEARGGRGTRALRVLTGGDDPADSIEPPFDPEELINHRQKIQHLREGIEINIPAEAYERAMKRTAEWTGGIAEARTKDWQRRRVNVGGFEDGGADLAGGAEVNAAMQNRAKDLVQTLMELQPAVLEHALGLQGVPPDQMEEAAMQALEQMQEVGEDLEGLLDQLEQMTQGL